MQSIAWQAALTVPVDEKTAEFNATLAAMMKNAPPMKTLKAADIRAAREAGKGIFGLMKKNPHAHDEEVDGVPIRIFPAVDGKPKAVIYHIHGGGWTLGLPYHYDELLWHFCHGNNATVVSVDYRLAPENPYPAGPDDCEKVARWLLENAFERFTGGEAVPLLITGDSAGAHLSVVTLLRLKKSGLDKSFSAALLLYGMYDLAQMTPSCRNWGSEVNLILNTPTIEWFVGNFVPERQDRDNEDVSPLFAKDLSNLPPALFVVGTRDPLLDDSLFMYTRWLAAGNKAELEVFPGGIHAFDRFDTPISVQAHKLMTEWLNGQIAAAVERGL